MKTLHKHIVFWVLYTVYFSFMDWLQYPTVHLVDEIILVLIHVWIFYSAYYFLQRLSLAGWERALKSIGYFLLSLGVFALLDYIYKVYLLPYFHPSPKRVVELKPLLVDGIVWYIQFFLYALGYYYAKKYIIKERALRQQQLEQQKQKEQTLLLQQKNLQLEKEKLKAEQEKAISENLYLRSQINPHFLHNTLNFFYSRALPYSEELSESILTLSAIMRYSLENEEDDHGLVLLSKEIEHLQNVIKINQLRFSNSLHIRLHITGRIENVRIIPLVLMTLVENAFKHGDLSDNSQPLRIELQVDDADKKIRFCLRNKIKTGPEELSHGIGVDNTRRRLNRIYGTAFSFTISETDQLYETMLILPIAVKDPVLSDHVPMKTVPATDYHNQKTTKHA